MSKVRSAFKTNIALEKTVKSMCLLRSPKWDRCLSLFTSMTKAGG